MQAPQSRRFADLAKHFQLKLGQLTLGFCQYPHAFFYRQTADKQ